MVFVFVNCSVLRFSERERERERERDERRAERRRGEAKKQKKSVEAVDAEFNSKKKKQNKSE